MQAYPFCICYGRLLVNAISLPDRSGKSNIYPLCVPSSYVLPKRPPDLRQPLPLMLLPLRGGI